MTKKEKQILMDAAGILIEQKLSCICPAIDWAFFGSIDLSFCELRKRFGDFFNMFCVDYWPWDKEPSQLEQRLMALAMFMELEGKI